jgi:8-oxo-dGTP diphosphatase
MSDPVTFPRGFPRGRRVRDGSPAVPAGPRRVVASCALIESGCVLLVREGQGHEAGRWNLPGGKCGRGESILDTAIRETREECGFGSVARHLLGVYPYVHRTGDRRLRVVLWADVIAGALAFDGREIIDARWFELARLGQTPDDRLAKPALMRAIFADLLHGRRQPLQALSLHAAA